MRSKRYKENVMILIVIIIIMMIFAWWASGEVYHPRPTKEPTIVVPTRVTAVWTTATPTVLPTKTAIPSITNTQMPTVTAQPTATKTLAPTATHTPIILYKIVEDKEPDCKMYFIRPWGTKVIPRCWAPFRFTQKFVPPSIFVP